MSRNRPGSRISSQSTNKDGSRLLSRFKRRHLVFWALSAVILVGVMAVFLFRKPQLPTVPVGAKAGHFSSFPSQLKLGDQDYTTDLGLLIVHENRADPGSRLIALPVLRIRSHASRPAEPIFWLNGGPGASNMDFRPSNRLLENHDFILVGYRGVDGSVRLESPDIARATLGVDGDLTSPASISAFREAVARFAGDSRKQGIDLRGYTLTETIADMEDARKALGYDCINLLSASYGTRLAQIYALRHPKVLKRSAMISVNPPGHFAWDPHMTDRQLSYLSHLYSLDPLKERGAGDLKTTMRRVLTNLPTRYFGLRLDANKLRAMTFFGLFQRSTMGMVADAYLAADRGDYSGLALMQVSYDLVLSRLNVWGDFVCKGYNADYDPKRDYARDFAVGDTVMGAPLTLMSFEGGSELPMPLLPSDLKTPRDTDVETLLLGGNIDFSTPVEYARDELLPHLRHGQQIILTEMGHFGDVWSLEYHETQHALTTFFDTGVADSSRFKHLPMDFTVKWGFPLIAKILIGTILLGVCLILALLRWLWRKRGRRQAA